MKKLNFLPFIILSVSLGIYACNNPKNTDVSLDEVDSLGSVGTDTVRKAEINLEPCYLATIGKDSAFLEIKQHDKKLDGKILYQYNDDRKPMYGAFTGKIQGDTLTIEVRDISTEQMQEITFLIREEQIIQGQKIEELPSKSSNNINKALVDYTGKSFVFLPAECRTKQGKSDFKSGGHL
ncbi:hypothetical protein FYC62_06265 [Pedobacter aquae]|uniref:NlpE-like protein n=1 Tax=Pedobacter aquae TaxID=2605747 RepID=A0A5C0VHH1_9SPHI|nr:hypothetical protein [Pedobacter aquae]QEK51312.1 hypothetical protein FYC62_06265 [Pedobacter aquae]